MSSAPILPRGQKPWGSLPKQDSPKSVKLESSNKIATGGRGHISTGRVSSSLMEAYRGLKTGAGGIGEDFPQGYIGSPFWFSNIGGNHFPREGFTYQPWDIPVIDFSQQMQGYKDDTDAQMGINFLAAKSTGGMHYFKGKTERIISHVTKWTKQVNMNKISWQIAKELLGFGNSFWRLRRPIWECDSFDDFMQIPIESSARIWWTPDRRPLWYEFRGAQYNGYFRPNEIIHFSWNSLNGQIYGFGIMAQLVNKIFYYEDTADGPVLKQRESLMDIKHGMQNTIYKTLKRYIPRNVYNAKKADDTTLDNMRDSLKILNENEDVVAGIPELEIKELGSATRAFDPSGYADLFQSDIFKAIGSSKGRIAAGNEGPTYANGKESSVLDEIGLAMFPLELAAAITKNFIKPWYQFNQVYDPMIAGGLYPVPWEVTDLEFIFGKQEKVDMDAAAAQSWAQMLNQTGSITPLELRKAAEKYGFPLISTEEGKVAAGMGTPNNQQQNKPGQSDQEKNADQFGKEPGEKKSKIPNNLELRN